MVRKMWFQLVDSRTRAAYANTTESCVRLPDAACIEDLQDAVFADVSRALPPRTTAANLEVYPNRAAYDGKHAQPLQSSASVSDLGGSGKDTIIVVVPVLCVSPILLTLDGISHEAPHLAREVLLDRIYENMNGKFTLFISPAASGKTSLSMLFARRYPDVKCIYISLHSSEASAAGELRTVGIDVYGRSTNISQHQRHVVVLDDAQGKYHEKDFWSILIKDAPSWLPMNLHFIICAVHALEGGIESPIEFGSLLTFGRKDFLLTNEEAHQFLALPFPIGLPDHTKKRTFMELVIRESNGLIGALRIAVNAVNSFRDNAMPSETELIENYLSKGCLRQMARCFGSAHTPLTSLELRDFLIECLAVAPNGIYLKSKLTDEDHRRFVILKKAGILVEDADQLVRFSSPLAERYYSDWLFRNRAHVNPSSLHELITKVVGNMSASALRQSQVDSTSFPSTATFRHQFIEGFALNTRSTCSICPELSRTFPSSSINDGDQQSPKADGETSFYLGGDLRWGLELLLNVENVSEHMAGFASNGKYAALVVQDYAVIDLRVSETGDATNVSRIEKKVTVLFKLGDYSSCKCVFGMDEAVEHIALKM